MQDIILQSISVQSQQCAVLDTSVEYTHSYFLARQVIAGGRAKTSPRSVSACYFCLAIRQLVT